MNWTKKSGELTIYNLFNSNDKNKTNNLFQSIETQKNRHSSKETSKSDITKGNIKKG